LTARADKPGEQGQEYAGGRDQEAGHDQFEMEASCVERREVLGGTVCRGLVVHEEAHHLAGSETEAN
jgi:hypothetical protein